MQIRDVMTPDPQCCTQEATLQEAARLMADNDCGEIPIVDEQRHPVGVITDRDIACRGVAEGRPADTPVREVMTNPAITVTPETSLEDCCTSMAQGQIRRMPVVDESGACCGMVSQADMAQHASQSWTAQTVQGISLPTPQAAST